MDSAEHGQHLDEGTIHAWLDDALFDAERERVETHVRECAECAARVAEARGLIAGASRVVSLLDEEPASSLQMAGAPSRARKWRVTPVRAAIAAALVIAVGLTVTRPKSAVEDARFSMDSASSSIAEQAMAPAARAPAGETPVAPMAPTTPMASMPALAENQSASKRMAANSNQRAVMASPPVAAAVTSPLAKDHLLDSAVARRLAQDNPTRVMRASPEAAMPAPSAPRSPRSPTEALGAVVVTGVAEGVAAERRQVLSAPARADKARVNGGRPELVSGCHRIELVGPLPKEWKGAPLPFTIKRTLVPAASEGGEKWYGVTAPTGTRMIGSWSWQAGGKLALELELASSRMSGRFDDGESERAGRLEVGGTSVAVVARAVSCDERAR